ncbi:AraC-like DNA-binding protein [Roseibium hamelinense]|uniref:AraC-like DNA-binding protein n=1 Tax=Roseibium hamelinense TaxID=150831 RepID=A0A562SU72_9HYPH|nr:AraC family transcriptional regulator [Roseibium hamelinense]TWI84653.1 AraC-like DNA-binding protein [Roseibium hamelinense]
MNSEPAREWAQAEQCKYLEPFLAAHGHDWSEIADKFNLPDTVEGLAGRKLDMGTLLTVFEHSATLTGDDAGILDIYYELPDGAMPIFDYLAFCAPSLREALKNWERYISVQTNSYWMRFEETEDYGIVSWDIPDRLGPRTQNLFAKTAWAAGRIERMIAKTSAKLVIEMTVAPPVQRSRFQETFGNRVRFGRQHDRILIPSQFLDTVPPRSEPNLLYIVATAANAEIEAYRQPDAEITKIITGIVSRIENGFCSLDQVATDIGMSPRTIQRHLENEGTSFRTLADNIRKSMARRYLQETPLTIKEIAYILGFTELSSFSRAVKSWFGCSPSALRNNGRLKPAKADEAAN